MSDEKIPNWKEPKDFTIAQMEALLETAASLRPITFERALREMLERYAYLKQELVRWQDAFSEEGCMQEPVGFEEWVDLMSSSFHTWNRLDIVRAAWIAGQRFQSAPKPSGGPA